MNRKGHPRSKDDALARRTTLLLFGYLASFVVTIGVFAFALLRFLNLIDTTGSDRAAPSFTTFALPVLLSIVILGTLWLQKKLQGSIAKLKTARSSGEALRLLYAAQHNVRGCIPAPPGQFEEALQVLARQGVNVRLLVGDEANFQVLASLPNVEVRLSDSKTGFLIIDDVSTVSGPGTEFAEENNAHVYIDTPGTPEAVEELHRVIEAFDNAFDLSTALTASELTKPNTH